MGTKGWPRWSRDRIRAGFPESSLLAGTEAALWEALGRLEPRDFDCGKQVVLRRALDAVGLGWVATNTTPFRIAVGGLFDAAEECHRARVKGSSRGGHGAEEKSSARPEIDVGIEGLPESEDAIRGPLAQITPTRADRKALRDQLATHGAYVIRKAVPASALKQTIDTADAKETKLARTMGNGVAGAPASVYRRITEAPDWHDRLERALGGLLTGPGAPDGLCGEPVTLARRSILLLAGEGAENWAHQDGNDETPPLQAVLMLSEPRKDFDGGEFYVARQVRRTGARIEIVRHEVPFESPGDLVIFEAGRNSGWWHGMLPVKPGSESRDGHLREAVGMLQPPT